MIFIRAKCFDDEKNDKYRITYDIGFGGHAQDGTDCTGRVSAGIDIRAYYIDDTSVDLIDESKKNELKDRAKKHKKTDKKG